MEFFTDVLEILVWPLTTLLVVYILKTPVLEILATLTGMKQVIVAEDFNNELDKLQNRSDAIRSIFPNPVTPDKEEEYYLDEVKKSSPRAAILESWIALENSVTSTYRLLDLDSVEKVHSFSGILKSLVNKKIISSDTFSIVSELRVLRNKAVHNYDFNITELEASKFIQVSREQSEIIIGEIWKLMAQNQTAIDS
ncbi:DUF4145 domain-containing protein [uncultured Endozoicomonas sp.]|uniref:DUF4145 domain-containing protein n=1 Tax=uncultured Endozoicomonas sp. TaxID=432652 RepID=UPI002606629E|nr:DUF4145 domain-containing protein [uncultured Endozoicomonas sp.]